MTQTVSEAIRAAQSAGTVAVTLKVRDKSFKSKPTRRLSVYENHAHDVWVWYEMRSGARQANVCWRADIRSPEFRASLDARFEVVS